MTIPEPLANLASGHTATVAAIALVAATAFALAIRALRRNTTRPPAAVLVAALAAAACTAYSADTSWRFARDHLGMTSATERGAMFAAAELALFSVALMARQNLNTTNTPGTPGVLVWVITGVQVIPAFSESGLIGGFVRAFVGPILAALLWHLAMGIELRHHKPSAESQALWAILVREARERAMSRLGLAVRDRTAEQITRDRWTRRAVAHAAHLSELGPKPTGRLDRRRASRIAHRLSIAVGRAQVGADPVQRQMLLSLLAARRHATALATMDLASPWTGPGAGRGQVVICQGPHGIRIPYPKPRPVTAPTEPAGAIGGRVEDVDAILRGVHAPIVYFIKNGNRIKIGTSTNLRKRVAALALSTRSIALVLHGGVTYERELHARFAAYRTPGTEWFDYARPLANFVASGGSATETPEESATEAAPKRSESAAEGATEAPREPAAERFESATTEPVALPKRSVTATAAPRKRSKPGDRDAAKSAIEALYGALGRRPTEAEMVAELKRTKNKFTSPAFAKNIRTEIETDDPALAALGTDNVRPLTG